VPTVPTVPGTHSVFRDLSELPDNAAMADLTHPSERRAPVPIGVAGGGALATTTAPLPPAWQPTPLGGATAAESSLGRAALGSDPSVGLGLAGAQKMVGESISANKMPNVDKTSSFVAKVGSYLPDSGVAFREDGGRLEAMRSPLGSMGRIGDGASPAGGLAPPGGVVATAGGPCRPGVRWVRRVLRVQAQGLLFPVPHCQTRCLKSCPVQGRWVRARQQ